MTYVLYIGFGALPFCLQDPFIFCRDPDAETTHSHAGHNTCKPSQRKNSNIYHIHHILAVNEYMK